MTAILVPVKDLQLAKSRLAAVLDGPERESLARALVVHVLTVVRRASSAAQPFVLSPDPSALALAEQYGATALAEPRDVDGLNGAVVWGLARLRERGHRRVIVLFADLPLLQPEELREAVVALGAGPDTVLLAPSLRGGTSLLGVARVTPPALVFGEQSARRFHEVCDAAGLGMRTFERSGLYHDLDEPEDIEITLRSPDCAPAVRAVLERAIRHRVLGKDGRPGR